jgi:hypothetical protein
MGSQGVAGAFTVGTIAGLGLLLWRSLIVLRTRQFPSARSWCGVGSVGFTVCFLAYALLGDWGHVTTKTLDPKSARCAGLVWSGAGALMFALIAVVAASAMVVTRMTKHGDA